MKKFEGFEESHRILIGIIACLMYYLFFVLIFYNIVNVWLSGGMTWLMVAWVLKYCLDNKQIKQKEKLK